MQKEEFEDIFRRCYGKMIRLAQTMLKDVDEAKDVVSEVFTQLWHGSISLENKSDEGYLLVCTRNRCIDQLNRRSMKERVHKLMTLESSPAIEMPFDDGDWKLERIREIVDTRLYGRDQEVILMKYEQKMKYREMADALSISEAAVYKHLSHAIQQIKTLMNDGNR